MKYTANQQVEMYEKMLLGRKYENKMLDFVNQGKLQGFFHLAIGQEAAQVGTAFAMGEGDYIAPTHRAHPLLLCKLDIFKLTAEVLGKADGYNKGKAFTFHISSKEDRVLPICGMLGAGIPVSTGTAFSVKSKAGKDVVVCMLGDGTLSEGNVYEAMNIASLQKLPIVYVIENNGYAISQPANRQANLENLSDRAVAFGMKGVTVDGNDVIAVRSAVEEAIELARDNQPSIVELKTYRLRAHFEGDPCLYRTNEEVEAAMKKCPIERFEKQLIEEGILNEQLVSDISGKIDQLVEKAFDYGFKLEMPTVEMTLDINDVYATVIGGELF